MWLTYETHLADVIYHTAPACSCQKKATAEEARLRDRGSHPRNGGVAVASEH